jgi:hypothetical protein
VALFKTGQYRKVAGHSNPIHFGNQGCPDYPNREMDRAGAFIPNDLIVTVWSAPLSWLRRRDAQYFPLLL